MKVFGRVLIRRAVTAADVATGLAKTQMHPGVTRLQAIFTALRAGRDCPYLIEVGTLLSHGLSLLIQDTAKPFAWQRQPGQMSCYAKVVLRINWTGTFCASSPMEIEMNECHAYLRPRTPHNDRDASARRPGILTRRSPKATAFVCSRTPVRMTRPGLRPALQLLAEGKEDHR